MNCYNCGQPIEKIGGTWGHPPGTLGIDHWQEICPGMWGAPRAEPEHCTADEHTTPHRGCILR